MRKKTKALLLHIIAVVIIVGVIGSLGLLISGGFSAFAGPAYYHDDSDYADIKTLDYAAVLKENGDLEVEEVISFDIKAKSQPFRELYRELNLTDYDLANNVSYDLDSITVLEVNADGTETKFPFLKNNPNRTPGFFKLYDMNADTGHLMEVRWYINIMAGKPVYRLSYTFKNVLRKYSDAAELNITPYTGGSIEYIDRFTAKIEFPDGITSDSVFRLFHHNQPDGSIRTDGSSIRYAVSDPAYNIRGDEGFIEMRAVMGKSALPVFATAQHISNKYTYSSILSEEAAWAEKAASYTPVRTVSTLIDIILALLIAAFSVFWYKYNKNKMYAHRPNFRDKYYKGVPSGLDPYIGAKLVLKFGNGNDWQPISAALLKLSMTGVIKIEKINEQAPFRAYNTVIRFNAGGEKKLKEDSFEFSVYCYLFDISNDKYSVKMTDIIEDARTEEGNGRRGRLFGILNAKFKETGLIEAPRPQGVSLRKLFTVVLGAAGFLGYLFLGVNLMPTFYSFAFFAGFSLLIGAAACFVSAFPRYVLTKKGTDLYVKFNASYSFLCELPRMEKAGLEDVQRWDDCLTYASALGIPKNVTDALAVHELASAAPLLSYNYNDFMSLYGACMYLENTQFYSPPVTYSGGSDWSGGSSGGGGFSGGGGGGSGGGGGGGRH